MKTRYAALALVMVSGLAVAQRSIVSLNTTNELAARNAITGETVTVLNQTSGTNFGPSKLWRHVTATNLTPGNSVIPALPSGRWLAVTDPAGSGSGAGFNGIIACADDSTTHQLTVTKVGSAYVLNVGQTDAGSYSSYPSLVSFIADDATVHALRVQKVGTNYTLTLTQ